MEIVDARCCSPRYWRRDCAAIAGRASLVTFPTLLRWACRRSANATNAVGLSLSNFMAAVADWRRRPSWGRSLTAVRDDRARWRRRRAAAADDAGPLILLCRRCRRRDALFAIGPWVQRHLPRGGDGGLRMARVAFPLFLSAIYGGYFGAALGHQPCDPLDRRADRPAPHQRAQEPAHHRRQRIVGLDLCLAGRGGVAADGGADGQLDRRRLCGRPPRPILPPRLVRIAIITFGTAATALFAGRYWF